MILIDNGIYMDLLMMIGFGSSNNRKSTSGFCFGLGSVMISWASRKKTFVSLSTAKVEYIVPCFAYCEVVWL